MGILKEQSQTIGLGLASSMTLSLAMDGDIKLKESKSNLTVFGSRIPIKAQVQRNSYHFPDVVQLAGDSRELSPSLKDYLHRRIKLELPT